MIKELIMDEDFLKTVLICLGVITVFISAMIIASTPEYVNVDNSTTVENYITNNTTVVQPPMEVGFQTRGECVLVENPGSPDALMRCALTPLEG
jgi:hypothetical protein